MLNLHPIFCNCIIHDKEEKINSLFNEIFMNIALFFRHIVKIRFCVRLRDNRTHRYKSPVGIFDIRPGRSICAAHSICPAGREGIYIISNLPLGKYIDFFNRKKYRIAQQYIDKKQLPEEEKTLFRVVLVISMRCRGGVYPSRLIIYLQIIRISKGNSR